MIESTLDFYEKIRLPHYKNIEGFHTHPSADPDSHAENAVIKRRGIDRHDSQDRRHDAKDDIRSRQRSD